MKILLAEDQVMIRTALASLLRLEGQYEVIEVPHGKKALSALKEQEFDLLLTDIEMPYVTGIELAQFIKESGMKTKVVIITTFGRSGYVKRAMEAQVNGFILKDKPVEELIIAIEEVRAGKRVVDHQLLLDSIESQDPLNEKERQALRLAAEGKSTKEIAHLLFIAEGTARNYLSEASSKLNAKNRIEAARIARQNGWL